MDSINKGIEFLKEQTIYFNKLLNDKDFLFEEINNIKPDHIDFLINLYKEAKGPVNILRLFILKAIDKNAQKP